jgi:hypothetical protein
MTMTLQPKLTAPALAALRWECGPEPDSVHLAYDHPAYGWNRIGGIHPFTGAHGTAWRGFAAITWEKDQARNAQYFVTKETAEAARAAVVAWVAERLSDGVEGGEG